jgi:hypothetical protein
VKLADAKRDRNDSELSFLLDLCGVTTCECSAREEL